MQRHPLHGFKWTASELSSATELFLESLFLVFFIFSFSALVISFSNFVFSFSFLAFSFSSLAASFAFAFSRVKFSFAFCSLNQHVTHFDLLIHSVTTLDLILNRLSVTDKISKCCVNDNQAEVIYT